MLLSYNTVPQGKYVVIEVDFFDNGNNFIESYEDKDEALLVACAHNSRRNKALDKIYYVYNDKGECLNPYLV